MSTLVVDFFNIWMSALAKAGWSWKGSLWRGGGHNWFKVYHTCVQEVVLSCNVWHFVLPYCVSLTLNRVRERERDDAYVLF